jgi:hypothetical protein
MTKQDVITAEVGTTSRPHGTGSLTRRMIVVAAVWISILLAVGGFALDRLLTNSLVRNFDENLELVLRSMIGSSENGTVVKSASPARAPTSASSKAIRAAISRSPPALARTAACRRSRIILPARCGTAAGGRSHLRQRHRDPQI